MLKKYLNKVIQGDSLEVLSTIPDKSINTIFADPPYFMQTEGELLRTDGTKFLGVEDKWDKFSDYKQYDEFCYNWLKESKRILKDDGTIWVIGSFQNIYRIGYIMQNVGFWILNDIIWGKPNAVPNFAGTRFKNSHETMLWCSKSKTSKYTFNYKTMKHLNDDKQDKSIWDIGICIGNERIKKEDGKKAHSTQKPEKLLYKVILSSTKPSDIILDPFFGTGTTGAVAKKLGRNFIGIEREDDYIKVANKRIQSIDASCSSNQTILKDENIKTQLVQSELEDSLNNDKKSTISNITEYDIVNLKLEVKPPKVPIKNLIQKSYLYVGQDFYNKNGVKVCSLKENGNVYDNEEELSIHKMSAKYLNKTNNNGWSYFYIYYKEEFLIIDDLRYKYEKEINVK